MEILYSKSTQVLHDEFVPSAYREATGYTLLIHERGAGRREPFNPALRPLCSRTVHVANPLW